jgi:hypothetical protein
MKPEYRDALLGPDGCLAAALAGGEAVALRISGGCMEPTLADGSAVRIERTKFYVPGDVVAFHCPHQGRLLVHRFLGYVRRRGTWKLMTMPDRGLAPDPLVEASRVLGRVVGEGGTTHAVTPGRRLRSAAQYLRWSLRYAIRKWLS